LNPASRTSRALDRLPQRTSLVAQAADVLRQAIASGQWSRSLPGEIELARNLHVSRVTLRVALAELEREKLIRGGQGKRRQIIAKDRIRKPKVASKTVVLLSPVPVHQLPASTVFWVDGLREHLDAAGWPLDVRESSAAYRRRPGHALDELSARLNPGGWILYRSTFEMQRWFSVHAPAAVIAGSPHAGVPLSSVDVDHAAGCRHAAGRFIANGHTRLAIVRPDARLAGDFESVAGFEAGAGAQVPSVLHDGTLAGICMALERVFSRKPAPTGLFVFHASHLLTVLGWLHRHRLRVPLDVSVLCRDSEPFLEFVTPSPTRYLLNAGHYARRISRLVDGLLVDGPGRPKQLRIMPTALQGETLAPAR
jgi:DNA-binding LacI/PurR family transcriptional regulator